MVPNHHDPSFNGLQARTGGLFFDAKGYVMSHIVFPAESTVGPVVVITGWDPQVRLYFVHAYSAEQEEPVVHTPAARGIGDVLRAMAEGGVTVTRSVEAQLVPTLADHRARNSRARVTLT